MFCFKSCGGSGTEDSEWRLTGTVGGKAALWGTVTISKVNYCVHL